MGFLINEITSYFQKKIVDSPLVKMVDFFYISKVKDLSNYIESLLDDINSHKEVSFNGDNYIIHFTHYSEYPSAWDEGATIQFLELSYGIKVRKIMSVFFPNDEIDYTIVHRYMVNR